MKPSFHKQNLEIWIFWVQFGNHILDNTTVNSDLYLEKNNIIEDN